MLNLNGRYIEHLEGEVGYLRERVALLEAQVSALHAQGLAVPAHLTEAIRDEPEPVLDPALEEELSYIEDPTARAEMRSRAIALAAEKRELNEIAAELFG